MHSAKRLFAVADIKEPRHAAGCEFYDDIAEFYPFLRCLVRELNYFYDTSIPMNEEIPDSLTEQAAAAFVLCKSLSDVLEIHPEFSGQKPLLKKLDQELSSDLGQIIEYLGCNGDTMQNIKAYNWMRQALLLSSLQVQEGKHRQEQYIFQEIADAEIAPSLWDDLVQNGVALPELSEESLNQIIFLSCRNVLGRMNLADNNEISTMLLNSLRSSDGIKLRRRVVFSPQTLQPIAQIVSENNHTYYNLKNSYRMLSMALDELPLLVNGRKLEEMIKRQKLDEYSRLRPVNQKYFSLGSVGGNPPMDETDYRQAGKLFRKQYAAEQKWELYEREVSLPPKIQADFNRLLKNWVAVEEDNLYTLGNNLAYAKQFVLNQEEIPDQKNLKMKILHQAQGIVKVGDALREFAGIEINDAGVTLSQLKEIRDAERPLDRYDLNVVNMLLASFEQNFDAQPGRFIPVYNASITESYADKLDMLPDGLQKYKVLYYSSQALHKLERNADVEMKNSLLRCTHEIRNVDRKERALLHEYLNGFSPGSKYNTAELAEQLEMSLAKNFLLPLYTYQQVDKDAWEHSLQSIPAYNRMTRDELDFFRALGKMHLDNVYEKHHRMVASGKFPTEELAEHIDSYLFNRNISEKLFLQHTKVAAIMKEQQPCYYEYRKFKDAQKQSRQTTVSPRELVLRLQSYKSN